MVYDCRLNKFGVARVSRLKIPARRSVLKLLYLVRDQRNGVSKNIPEVSATQSLAFLGQLATCVANNTSNYYENRTGRCDAEIPLAYLPRRGFC